MSRSSEDVFEVHCDPSVSVDTGKHICSCCQWKLKGFPCDHAVCAIKKSGKDINLFVEKYFHVESYIESYSCPISLIPTLWKPVSQYGENEILSPLCKKGAGRPKYKRILSRGEKWREIRCSRCKKLGNHNKKTCKEATT